MQMPKWSPERVRILPNILEVINTLGKIETRFQENGGWYNQCHFHDVLLSDILTHPGLDNPFNEYINHEHPEKFIVTRLKSGRFSLKPNLATQPYLYRGQKEHFRSILPMFERYTKDENTEEKRLAKRIESNLKVEEFVEFLRSHPLFMLFDRGIYLEGYNNPLFFEMNYYGLAQHYNFSSSLVDFTSDIRVAAFFASTINEGNDVYMPYGGNDDNPVGVIYIHKITPEQSFNFHQFRTIGLQVYPRSGAQKGFFYQTQFPAVNVETLVKPYYFRHDLDSSKKIFEYFKGGQTLFPKDDVSPIAKEILKKKTVSGFTFVRNLYSNDDDFIKNIKHVRDRGIYLNFNEHWIFTPETLKGYYSDIKNGLWEEFCKQIAFVCKSRNKLMSELLNLPDNPNYKQYFEEKYWDNLMFHEKSLIEQRMSCSRNRTILNKLRL